MNFLNHFAKRFSKSKSLIKKTNRVGRVWVLMLISSFLLFVLGVVFGVYVFLDINSFESADTITTEQFANRMIDQELLNETIDFYTKKAEQFKAYVENPPNIPSI